MSSRFGPLTLTLLPLTFVAACTVADGTAGTAGAARDGAATEKPSAGAPAPRPATSVPVTVSPVERKSMPIETTAVGAAEAFSTVAIRAQVTGELTSVNFDDGQEVTKGQVLFTLDKRPFEATLNQAEATLQRDIAQAANARAVHERYRGLADRGIATREQVDTSAAAATALEATVAADRAAIESAKVQLSYTTIVAPLSGRTGKLMVHAGNLVRATDASPLVVINQVSPIYVSFAIPEGDLPALKRFMALRPLDVEAQPPNDPAGPTRGRVSFVDNAVDPTTGTITVRGTFSNQDRRLTPGQFVNVRVRLGTDEDATVIPTAAIQTGQQGPFVFVMKPDKTADLRPIRIARTAGQETLVDQGLTPGETVVREGQLRLAPGIPMMVRGEQP